MSSSLRQRRARGGPAAQFNTRVDPEIKARIDMVADVLAKSQGQIIDMLFEHVDVDAAGNVHIHAAVLENTPKNQEELPLVRSA